MEKELYIKEKIDQLSKYWYGIASTIGASLFLLLGIMDYFSTPENFSRFLTYRFGASLLLFGSFFVNRKIKDKYRRVLFSYAIIVSAAAIELMVLDFGGHRSTYYVGFIILVICIFGLIPMNIPFSLVGISLIYFIYLIPILIFDSIVDIRTFITANSFLISFFAISVVWRYASQKNLIKTYSLEYDLSQEKERLQQYSTHLEDIVAQRTKELAISEQKFRGLFDNASDGVAVYDSAGIIINVNQKFCEQHGFPVDALIGTNIRVFDANTNDEEKEERIKRIADGEALIYEAKHVHRSGDTILLEISAKALLIDGQIYIQAFHRDISDKKRLQEQLFQSQKMDSIGMLAGGLAHDFNNVISAIIGHIELLGEQDNLDAHARKRLAIIESSSRRASKMISKLLRFARKGVLDMQPVDLNAVVRDTHDLIGKTLSIKNVEVSLELDETIPALMGDANQVEQIILNLMGNAGDAMPSGGVLTIKTAAREIGREASFIHPLLTPGPYVILTVSDTGTGIPEEIRSRIFDPFFTTKEPGKGTGLGLAMVYGIVKEHKGVITVITEPGKGTIFTVYIPASQQEIISRSSLSEFAGAAMGTVLIIDDHKDILLFATETVESLGFTVKSTTNAIIALQMFKESAPDIALVITDIFMPLIDGRDLIKNMRSVKPSLKVIAMSGYQIEHFVHQDCPVDAFLRKPFGKVELIAAVTRIMQPSSSLNR